MSTAERNTIDEVRDAPSGSLYDVFMLVLFTFLFYHSIMGGDYFLALFEIGFMVNLVLHFEWRLNPEQYWATEHQLMGINTFVSFVLLLGYLWVIWG